MKVHNLKNYSLTNVFRFILVLIVFFLIYSCNKEDFPDSDKHLLPVVELEIAEKHLWSIDSGLYVIGNNGSERCRHVANYNTNWEHPAVIRYFENDVLQFTDNIGIRIKGNCSRKRPMKTLGLYWRNKYGNNRLNYQIFDDSPVNNFKRLLLRNSGNDFGITHLKCASISDVYKDYAKVDYQKYKPCVVYINDDYWGIHNIRDMLSARFFESTYGINPEMVDIIRGSEITPDIDTGTDADWNRDVISFLQNNDVSINQNYTTISNRIDIESYIDYNIVQTYIGNRDWPVNNTRWWRSKNYLNHLKWKWIIFDLDLSMLKPIQNRVWIGDLYKNHTRDGKEEGFFVFNHLIKNEHFVEQFLERYLFFIDEVFEPNRFEQIITQNKARIQPEYKKHIEKWSLRPMGAWEREIDDIIDYNRKRSVQMKKIIQDLLNEI